MADVLVLATAGRKADELADRSHQEYPRVDYLGLQQLVSIDILDYGVYAQTLFGAAMRRAETQLRSDLYLAALGLLKKRSYRVVFAMSERVAIPLAAAGHVFPLGGRLVARFNSWSGRQETAITRLNLLANMDTIIVDCESMKRMLVELGAQASRVHVIHYAVDDRFFTPLADEVQVPGRILTVGEVRNRDYVTLFQAMKVVQAELHVAAGGRWYGRQKDHGLPPEVPENVRILDRLSPTELRQAYAQAQFSVIPLANVPFSAGCTTVLESMCMGRAVVASRSQGILDYVVDGETGILVTPGDVTSMTLAIEYLLAHPQVARRLGENGRRLAEEKFTQAAFEEKMAEVLCSRLDRVG